MGLVAGRKVGKGVDNDGRGIGWGVPELHAGTEVATGGAWDAGSSSRPVCMGQAVCSVIC